MHHTHSHTHSNQSTVPRGSSEKPTFGRYRRVNAKLVSLVLPYYQGFPWVREATWILKQKEFICTTQITKLFVDTNYRYITLHSNSFLFQVSSQQKLLLLFQLSSPLSCSGSSSQHSSSSCPASRTSGRGTYSLLARLVVVVVRLRMLCN